MSASNEWTEWHLTPKGWEKGSNRMDFNRIKTIETPEDRLLSYKYSEYQSSSFDKVSKNIEKIWTSNKNEEIERYISKYGICPEHL